ncbi:hypothetical protein VNO78_00518 [Psophocarpus tetragonolobus]|uniref:Uncharacterized protein n=1 Tax=Psophocarpus tetragonolobus TaxID=3891 RepID=A0AAN9XUP1_PSOTE
MNEVSTTEVIELFGRGVNENEEASECDGSSQGDGGGHGEVLFRMKELVNVMKLFRVKVPVKMKELIRVIENMVAPDNMFATKIMANEVATTTDDGRTTVETEVVGDVFGDVVDVI